MTVVLRPMTDAELSVRLVGQIEEYAEDLVRSGQASLADARERSTLEHAKLLPDGVRTAGHLEFCGLVDGATVGWIWVALPGSSPSRVDLAWIVNVEIDPAYRGRGYGRGILLAGERELVGRGVTRLGLNVFGHNPVARRLYDSLGYELTAQQMAKALAPTSAAPAPSAPPAASAPSAPPAAPAPSATLAPSAESAPPAVVLRPMTERELRAWLAEHLDTFVERLVKAGEATPEDAPAAVRASIAARLPDGVATPGQLTCVAEIEGVRVGRLWAALPGSGGQQRPGTAWIYDVHVEPAQRGRGYGRAVVEALERELGTRGVPRLGLNLYGTDPAVSRLYDSLGFQVTSAQMVKSLLGNPSTGGHERA